MEKIVILTSRPEPDNSLVALLNMVFPDSEVSLVFSPTEALEEVTTRSSFGSLLETLKGRIWWI